jgi:hypothetical protein
MTMGFQLPISVLFGWVLSAVMHSLLLVALAFISSAPAAQDYSPAMQDSGWVEAGRRGDPDDGSGKEDRIGPGPQSTPQRSPEYGAIAYDPHTNQGGKSCCYEDIMEARNQALRNCGRSGCSVVAEVRSDGAKCAALAVSNDGKYGVKSGSSESDASNQAVGICQSSSSWGGCQILLSVCSENP